MKVPLYWVADVLTSSRIFPFAFMMVIFTIVGAPPWMALVVFSAGELTDAFDGPAANRWPYPEYLEKRLWWRKRKVEFDMAADMILGVSALAYIAFRTYPIGMMLAKLVVIVGVVVQVLVVFWLNPQLPRLARTVILIRRRSLYVPLVAMVIVILLLAATVGIEAQVTWEVMWTSGFVMWLVFGISIGIVLVWYKWDRLVEVIRGESRRD